MATASTLTSLGIEYKVRTVKHSGACEHKRRNATAEMWCRAPECSRQEVQNESFKLARQSQNVNVAARRTPCPWLSQHAGSVKEYVFATGLPTIHQSMEPRAGLDVQWSIRSL